MIFSFVGAMKCLYLQQICADCEDQILKTTSLCKHKEDGIHRIFFQTLFIMKVFELDTVLDFQYKLVSR